MPTNVRMDDGVLFLEMIDTISGAEISELLQKIKVHEGSRSPDRITDLTRLRTAQISFVDIWDLARARMATKFPNSFKSAIVADQPLQVGFARMFISINEHPQISLRLFSDRSEALKWLRGPIDADLKMVPADPKCRIDPSAPVGFPRAG